MTCDVTYDSDGKQVGDAELFAAMKGAMKILSFSEQDQWELWKIVATVMHLGNFSFKGIIVYSSHSLLSRRLSGNPRV